MIIITSYHRHHQHHHTTRPPLNTIQEISQHQIFPSATKRRSTSIFMKNYLSLQLLRHLSSLTSSSSPKAELVTSWWLTKKFVPGASRFLLPAGKLWIAEIIRHHHRIPIRKN